MKGREGKGRKGGAWRGLGGREVYCLSKLRIMFCMALGRIHES